GSVALGYYTAKELRFYYGLFDTAGLCANYFCSVLGPTWPNRLYLMSGTSGGITTNGIGGYGVFDSAGWPTVLDLLDEAKVTWKIYSDGADDIADGDNFAVCCSRCADDQRTTPAKEDDIDGC